MRPREIMAEELQLEVEPKTLEWREVVEGATQIGVGAVIAFAILGGLFAACVAIAG